MNQVASGKAFELGIALEFSKILSNCKIIENESFYNARTLVEASLKFDVQIIGWPQQMGKHTINYG